MTAPPIRRLGLALDDDPLFASLVDAVRVAAVEVGLEPVDVRTPADEIGTDAVLVIGRPGRHTVLLAAPRIVPRIVWSGEPLGRLEDVTGLPRPVLERAATPRRSHGRLGRVARQIPLPRPLRVRREGLLGARLVRANLTELDWATHQRAHLVVTSHDRAAVLAARGIDAAVVPFGYHPALAGLLTGPETAPRDLPLISLGARSGHLRRGGSMTGPGLTAAQDPVVHLEGLWGAERDAVLRRARVMLDVHRIPGTFAGVRLVLALAAGVAVVTEPMVDPRPFVAGVTHLEVPVADMLPSARRLLTDEPGRRALVEAGQALLAGPLRLTASLRAVIASLPGPPTAG